MIKKALFILILPFLFFGCSLFEEEGWDGKANVSFFN